MIFRESKGLGDIFWIEIYADIVIDIWILSVLDTCIHGNNTEGLILVHPKDMGDVI